MIDNEMIHRALHNGSVGAVGAIRFITQLDVWPSFAAWAEQQTPGDQWTDEDRLDMAKLGDMFVILARELGP